MILLQQPTPLPASFSARTGPKLIQNFDHGLVQWPEAQPLDRIDAYTLHLVLKHVHEYNFTWRFALGLILITRSFPFYARFAVLHAFFFFKRVVVLDRQKDILRWV